jgi:hypothetical protein
LSRQGKRGRPTVAQEIRDLVRKISAANPTWGSPRIMGELRKRLEAGTFAGLDRDEINARELYLLMEGIEVVRERRRYARPHKTA